MHKEKLTKSLSIAVAVLTFVGIALHDTKIDRMTSIAIALPAALAVYEGAHFLMSGEAHTHVEKVSVGNTIVKNTSLLPKVQVRQNEDKKYRLQKGVPKGHHAFDNYSLPVLA